MLGESTQILFRLSYRVLFSCIISLLCPSLLIAEGAINIYGRLGSFCNFGEERTWNPGSSSHDEIFSPNINERRCSRSFVVGKHTKTMDEEYRLSFFDPIEVFAWDMRLKRPLTEWLTAYLKPPVLGEMRDRYINNWAFGDTLLFTTEIVGAGILLEWSPIKLAVEANSLHLYQRYGSNLLGTSIPYDPERTTIFGFNRTSINMQARTEIELDWLFIQGKWGHTEFRDGRQFREQELQGIAHILMWQTNYWQLGIHLETYRRNHNFRRDQAQPITYATKRYGVYFGF